MRSLTAHRHAFELNESSDVLILAAHQDDCVILAGEVAIECAAAGREVRVLYVTCGADDPADERARVRHEEALLAWALANVGASRIEQLDLPQSDVGGPLRWAAPDREKARGRLERAISALSRGAALFLPAAGESHCDHRALRELALEVLEDVERPDLQVFESPEYNSHYSLFRCPLRSLCYLGHTLPLVGRLIPASGAYNRAGFIHGPRGFRLPYDAKRLETKRKMLRQFVSEDGELLVRYFGHPDYFRPIRDIAAARRAETNPGLYVRVGQHMLGPSVLLLWLMIWSSVLLISFTAVQSLAKFSGISTTVAVVVLVVGAVAYFVWRAAEWERRITLASIAFGAIVAAFLPL